MPGPNYFDVLRLDADEVMSLSDADAEKRVRDAYSQLHGAFTVNEDNARVQALKRAKDCLVNADTRAQHAHDLGISVDRRVQPGPELDPQFQPLPPFEPDPSPFPHDPPPFPPDRPPFRRERESDGAAPSSAGGVLIGVAAAVPAAVLYLVAVRVEESFLALSRRRAAAAVRLLCSTGSMRFGLVRRFAGSIVIAMSRSLFGPSRPVAAEPNR